MKLVLPLKREKGSSTGEIEIELSDLHMQLSSTNSTTESDGHTQDNRTTSENGPTSTAVAAGGVASGVASLANDFNLMQLETPEPERRTGSVSQATTAASTATTRSTPTASKASTSANGSAQTTSSASDRQSVLAVPGAAGVAAVGGAATIATATGGNTRVPTPTSPAPNPPQRTPTPQVLSLSTLLLWVRVYLLLNVHRVKVLGVLPSLVQGALVLKVSSRDPHDLLHHNQVYYTDTQL